MQLWWPFRLFASLPVMKFDLPEPLPADADNREDVRWILERWLDNISNYKKQQWQFGYATLAAEGALCATLLSQPSWLGSWHGALIGVLAFGLWIVWAAAHVSINFAAENAQRGKDIAYRLLGEPLILARPPLDPRAAATPKVSQLIAVLVSAVSALAILLGAFQAIRPGGLSDGAALRVGALVAAGRCEDARLTAIRAADLDLAQKAVQLCEPKPMTSATSS